jgi:hypothetical protein
MAIGVIQEFDGATLDQYDQVVKAMGFEPGGAGAPGGLSHYCQKTDNGFRVVDVWESQEQFEKFAQEKIGPLAAEAGITSQPEVEFIEVHNYLTPG